MSRASILLLVVLCSAAPQGAPSWRGTSAHSIVDGTGDVLGTEGAAVAVSAESTGEAAFIGATASVDASSFRGREVRLAGRLRMTTRKSFPRKRHTPACARCSTRLQTDIASFICRKMPSPIESMPLQADQSNLG